MRHITPINLEHNPDVLVIRQDEKWDIKYLNEAGLKKITKGLSLDDNVSRREGQITRRICDTYCDTYDSFLLSNISLKYTQNEFKSHTLIKHDGLFTTLGNKIEQDNFVTYFSIKGVDKNPIIYGDKDQNHIFEICSNDLFDDYPHINRRMVHNNLLSSFEFAANAVKHFDLTSSSISYFLQRGLNQYFKNDPLSMFNTQFYEQISTLIANQYTSESNIKKALAEDYQDVFLFSNSYHNQVQRIKQILKGENR
ncbi:MAG: hypothetical protein KKF89_05460 [Nanoarchaeota archaeon]|nr:hypothetical protein [Nanoarchaeota archaeon]MBU1855143.1 hypothetical protein [Nanoarchaeota archaeon]